MLNTEERVLNISKELAELIVSKATLKKGTAKDNIKLGEMYSWAELAGNCEWYIPQLDLFVKGTCGKYCRGCFDEGSPRDSNCYVFKSYKKYTNRNEDGTVGDILMNPCTVKLGHAYRTIAMRFYKPQLLKTLDGQLTRITEPAVIRLNESGEIEIVYDENHDITDSDLEFWCKLAAKHLDKTFYIYTKNYDALDKAIEDDIIPCNFWINESIYHECGIEEFKKHRKHPQVKAYVWIDSEWTIAKYAEHGIIIETMCGAYDSKGRMNHDVTCDKCTKCFRHTFKVIGCFDHS